MSVAVGELADGSFVNLNTVPKNTRAWTAPNWRSPESQERMAVDVAAQDADEFLAYASEENLEAEVIATVTEEPRMTMVWNGDTIVDLSREFLASNGARSIRWCMSRNSRPTRPRGGPARSPNACKTLLTDLNVASNKGLSGSASTPP